MLRSTARRIQEQKGAQQAALALAEAERVAKQHEAELLASLDGTVAVATTGQTEKARKKREKRRRQQEAKRAASGGVVKKRALEECVWQGRLYFLPYSVRIFSASETFVGRSILLIDMRFSSAPQALEQDLGMQSTMVAKVGGEAMALRDAMATMKKETKANADVREALSEP